MTNKNVAAVRLVERDEAAEVVELPEELRVSLVSIAGVAREGLLAMSATVGLLVMHEMMNAEMTAKVGAAKHAKAGGPGGELACQALRSRTPRVQPRAARTLIIIVDRSWPTCAGFSVVTLG